jgi:photosystem II stability/assembly factor-like uncharacterized protein
MKQSPILPAFIAVLLVTGALGLAGGVVSQEEATPSVVPSPTPSAEAYLPWEPLNGPYERVTFALALVPGDARSTIYAGTWGHGVYRSRVYHDKVGDETWKRRGADVGRYVRALAVLPSDTNILYAGTSGEGLFRGIRGGALWEQLGAFSAFTDVPSPNRTPLRVESILILRDGEAERILVGTHNGVWASDDRGETWAAKHSGFDAADDDAYNVQTLAHDPAGTLYAGTLNGLYGSQDGGETWRFFGPPDDYPAGAHRILALTMVTDAARPTGTLLIGTQGAAIYALEDIESRSWLTRTVGLPDDPDAYTIQVLLSTPNGAVYAGTVDNGVLESRDGGQTWQQRVEGLPSHARSVLSLAHDPTDDALYAGTYGEGVYRLRAGSEAWEPANEGLPVDFAVQEIAFAGSGSEHLLTALRVGGMYLYRQQAQVPAWRRLPKALPIGPARDVVGLAVSGPDRKTVAIAARTGITVSTDAGETWRHVGADDGLPAEVVQINALAQGRQNAQILYAATEGGEGLYRSDNGGLGWEPAAGNLDDAVRTSACCLTVGANDDTLYLGLQMSKVYTRQVYLTRDAGATWRALAPLGDGDLQELAWGQRAFLEVFVYGGPRQMLYARTDKGITVSYDEGQSWQLRLRGFFNTLLVDPYRPWTVYAASPETTLDKEYRAPVPLTPDFWISYDGGETWTWSGPGPKLSDETSPASITTLAFDPKETARLFAGTEGAGVFWTVLPSHTRALTPRAVALIVILVLLLAAIAFTLWTGLTLGRRYRLPPSTWLSLAFLRAFHSTELHLVSDRHTPLTALERLVLALMPNGPLQAERMGQTLNQEEIPTDLRQVEMALQKLTVDYELLRGSEGGFGQRLPLLGRIARARFWENAGQRERLIKEIEGRSRLRADIRRFFKQAGFETFSFEAGFTVMSHQPEYRLLGAERGIYVHPHAAAEALPLQRVRDNVYRAFESQLASKIAFLVVTHCPPIEALREAADLRQTEDFRPVWLPYSHIRRTAETGDSRRVLDRSLRRSLGDQDLFALDHPARNPLDFFGRELHVQRLAENCENGRVAGLAGMAQVGKTSLLWQVMDRLPNALVARVQLDGPPTPALYGEVRRRWLAEARHLFPAWEQPRQSVPADPIAADQIAADLTALCDSLQEQGLTASLVALIDGLSDLQAGVEGLEPLAQAIAATPDASLVCVFSRPARSDAFELHFLPPLERKESAGLVNALAAQMGFGFDQEATDRLHRASGGHPRLLRQLASRSVIQKRDTGSRVRVADVEQAIAWYIGRRESALSELWGSLTEEEQSIVLAAGADKTPPDGDPLGQLESLGWLRPVDGGWELFSRALSRWLETHHPRRS